MAELLVSLGGLAAIAGLVFVIGWPIHVTGWRALRNRSAEMNT